MRIRAGTVADLPAITRVRTSVVENHLSVEQMAARGITHQSIAAAMASGELAAWVAADGNAVMAFAMANRESGAIWALFTAPEHEGKGYGTALLSTALGWLQSCGVQRAELDTERRSRAERFYRARGWKEHRPANADPANAYLYIDL